MFTICMAGGRGAPDQRGERGRGQESGLRNATGSLSGRARRSKNNKYVAGGESSEGMPAVLDLLKGVCVVKILFVVCCFLVVKIDVADT